MVRRVTRVRRGKITMRMPCLSKSSLEPESPNFCSSSTTITWHVRRVTRAIQCVAQKRPTCFKLRMRHACCSNFVTKNIFIVRFSVAATQGEAEGVRWLENRKWYACTPHSHMALVIGPVLNVDNEKHASSTVRGVWVMMPRDFARIRNNRLLVQRSNAGRK